jgi:hypothetical protein
MKKKKDEKKKKNLEVTNAVVVNSARTHPDLLPQRQKPDIDESFLLFFFKLSSSNKTKL